MCRPPTSWGVQSTAMRTCAGPSKASRSNLRAHEASHSPHRGRRGVRALHLAGTAVPRDIPLVEDVPTAPRSRLLAREKGEERCERVVRHPDACSEPGRQERRDECEVEGLGDVVGWHPVDQVGGQCAALFLAHLAE
eukprot:scaffold322242_cov30-Tisochrysis_lutea.AAC.4